jgi:hypothetical protein
MNRAKAITLINKEWITEIDNMLSVEIIDIIVEEAYGYWDRANCQYDFCVQNVGLGHITFGGTNRLIWNFQRGFRIDESYCSPNFIKANERISKL